MVLGAAILLVGLGVSGRGPLRFLHHDALAGPSGTVPTATGRNPASYAPGTCLTEDLGAVPETTLPPEAHIPNSQDQYEVVDCDQPHSFEVTGSIVPDISAYDADGPTGAQGEVLREGRCLDLSSKYLGHRLDLNGRFVSDMLVPAADDWRRGFHTIVCGLSLNSPNKPDGGRNVGALFSGKVDGADQVFLYGVGTCFGPSTPGELGPVVACTDPHELEVVGQTDVPGAPGSPMPDQAAMSNLASAACEAAAQNVYGAPLPPTVASGSLSFEQSSWDTGRRTVECVMGIPDAGSTGWGLSSRPLRR